MSIVTNPNSLPITATAESLSHGNLVASALDLLKPQELLQLIRPYGMENKMYLLTNTLGFHEAVAGEEFIHTEKDLLHATVHVDDQVAAAQQTFALVGNSLAYVYARVGDVLLYADATKATGVISDVTITTPGVTASITVEHLSGGATSFLPATTGGDTELIISTRVKGEGSNVGDPALSRTTKYTGQMQIIKDAIGATSTAITDETWIDFGDKGYYSTQFIDGEIRMMNHIEGMFLHGKANESDVVDPNSVVSANYVTSAGLIDTAITRGTTTTVPASITEFDDLTSTLIGNFVGTDVPIWTALGLTAYTALENALVDWTTAPSVDPGYLAKSTNDALYKAAQVYGVYANINYVNKKHTYMFELMENWSNPTSYGAQDYATKGMAIPIKKVKDGMSGEKFGTMGLRYKSYKGLNRKMMLTTLPGFGSSMERPINEIDYTKTTWLSHVGAQFFCGSQFIFMEA